MQSFLNLFSLPRTLLIALFFTLIAMLLLFSFSPVLVDLAIAFITYLSITVILLLLRLLVSMLSSNKKKEA